MKREKRLTKRERKALAPPRPAPTPRASTQSASEQHIHCIACGRHLDPAQFDETPPSATIVQCQHGSQFASCVACEARSKALLDEHDRTGEPVKAAQAWH